VPAEVCVAAVTDESATKSRNRSPASGPILNRGEKKANRNNPTFKNLPKTLISKEKSFSNRDKNTSSGSPRFRPNLPISPQPGGWDMIPASLPHVVRGKEEMSRWAESKELRV